MPMGRSFLSRLGEFSPGNFLRRDRSNRHPDKAQASPQIHPPSPKRRRTDDDDGHDDDDASPPKRSAIRTQNNQTVLDKQRLRNSTTRGHQQRLRTQPSETSLDILIQSSPDRSLYQRSDSVLSSGQPGSRTSNQINQNELRQVERNTNGTPNRRRRRRQRGGFGGEGAAAIGRPVNLRSPSPDTEAHTEKLFLIEDDLSPAKPNTNLSIDLSGTKGRFRDRMSSTQSSMGPPRRQDATPSVYNSTKHDAEVDELSQEFFPEPAAKRQQPARNPVIYLGSPPARAAGAAAERRRQVQLQQQREREAQDQQKQRNQDRQPARLPSALPMASRAPGQRSSTDVPLMAQPIIESPLRVKVAFRQPNTAFVADPDAGIALFSLTIKPLSPDVLVAVDPARARSENLFWLKVDLIRAREVSFNVGSPIVFFTFPQGDGLGALMGVQFSTVEEVRRLSAWIANSSLSQSIKLDQKASQEQLKRKFEKCLAEVLGHKEAKEQKESTPAKATAPTRSSPVVSNTNSNGSGSTEYMTFRRTRSSRNLQEATETIDLDNADNKRTGLLGSSPASSDVASDRLARLRNRSARLPPSRPLLQDVEAERWTLKNPDWARDWRIPLTYSRTTVDKDDVARLDEGEFLNDNIINFYMQFLQDTLKKSESTIATRVYFHNTFFYEKLRPSRGREIAFDGVKRWTAKTDLFSYDYIVVPVNEHAHWWLAIICNVPKILEAALPKTDDSEVVNVPEVTENAEEPTAAPVYMDVSVDVDVGAGPGAGAGADAGADADADADADDVKETGERRFVPIDVDKPKPQPRSVVINDEAGATNLPSASPSRLDGLRKDTPINLDGTDIKPDESRTEPIVLESAENDDDEAIVPASANSSPRAASKVHEIKDDEPNERQTHVADSADDDEVEEIKSDLVQPTTPQPASAKKPFRGGGALNSKKIFIPPGKKKDPKDPRIFTLDSLGSVHSASVDHLKQWMMAEIAERKGVKPADPGRLGMTAKAIPQQENFCDCGVYLLLYLQEFIKDPDSFIEDIVMRQNRTWDTSAPNMRKQLRDLILHMQKEYQAAEEAHWKPKRKLGTPATKRLDPASPPVVVPAATGASKTSDAQATPVQEPGLPLLPLPSPPAPASASRPTPRSDGISKDGADLPIPSSEVDQNGDHKENDSHGDDEGDSVTASAGSVEAGCSSPFKQGSKSPNMFVQHP
ncbi:SUMO protease ULP2 [Sporothrix schenckii 1099-18]|uniref:Ubiquitin-like protease family profile domain-containing protein n=1 Tax=Sporothrix schenckii 1099-18 TaxID=1397361 RepID=A0A0F2LW46_SPOSC|nr:SUMO protease ULP2 [Sporothrix schenckii 1099-18]KJR80720.1 hypothetical protein SPSK_04848 [Sporothrix schenckii 1099-18]